jgi:hypothetical protein
MSSEREIRESYRTAKGREIIGKYKPLPRNKQTEQDILRVFEYGTEEELSRFLSENGIQRDSPRSAEILGLFRRRGGKQL